jgi:hypothetical protein
MLTSESPVRELILLVDGDVTVVFEHVGQAERGELHHAAMQQEHKNRRIESRSGQGRQPRSGKLPRGLPGVKEVDDVQAEIALQPVHVHVGAVQNLDMTTTRNRAGDSQSISGRVMFGSRVYQPRTESKAEG